MDGQILRGTFRGRRGGRENHHSVC